MCYTIREERLTPEAYIDFLRHTDLGSQYPKERFRERIAILVEKASISLTARDDDDSLIGVVVDRFSDKVFIQPHNDGTFTVSTEVMLSPQFYGWVFSFGDKVRIVSPKAAKDGFIDYLSEVTEQYR